MPGLIGKKIGMTRIFDEAGVQIPVTVIEAGPCAVVQVKSLDGNGTRAVQLGFGAKKASRAAKAEVGHAAKAGLEGLARSLAVIGGPDGIRVNVVAPGAIDTAFDPPAFPAHDRPDVPLRRMGTADEVAGVVAFLLSRDAAYVSGAVWWVDGARAVHSPATAAAAASAAVRPVS